jgi:hypothetical protein
VLVLVSQGDALTSPSTHVQGGYHFYYPAGGGHETFFNTTGVGVASRSFSQSQLQYWNPYINDGKGAWVGGPWNITSSASASYGHLSAYSSSNFARQNATNDDWAQGGAVVETFAEFRDSLTINTPGFTQGNLILTYNITGNLLVTNATNESYATMIWSGGGSWAVGGGTATSERSINESYTYTYTFESGTPFNIYFQLWTNAADVGELPSSYAAANFSGSAHITSIGVFDLNDNPITNFTFSALSGSNYGLAHVSVPAILPLLLD